MIKTSTVTGGKTKQLEELAKVLAESEIENYTALELSCLIKCVEATLGSMRDKLRSDANAEFKEMLDSSPDEKTWTIKKMANVVKYSPRASWGYPEAINRASAELKATMKKMQNDGTATRTVPEVDPTKSYTFAITPVK